MSNRRNLVRGATNQRFLRMALALALVLSMALSMAPASFAGSPEAPAQQSPLAGTANAAATIPALLSPLASLSPIPDSAPRLGALAFGSSQAGGTAYPLTADFDGGASEHKLLINPSVSVYVKPTLAEADADLKWNYSLTDNVTA